MKVYISADIEGVAGVVARDQLGPTGFDYESARRLMTEEARAAIAGARAAGATEFVVSDSHGNGQNLFPDAFENDVTLVRSWPRPLSMMEGIQAGGFAGVFLVGYHASVGAPRGCLAHTMSSRVLSAIALNGEAASEAMISAAIAGEYGAPTLLATGDDAFVDEVSRTVAPAVTVTTKQTAGATSAWCKAPALVREEIAAAAERALASAGTHAPFRIETPVTVDLTMTSRLSVEHLAYLPMIERTGALSVRFEAKDMTELSGVLTCILGYAPVL